MEIQKRDSAAIMREHYLKGGRGRTFSAPMTITIIMLATMITMITTMNITFWLRRTVNLHSRHDDHALASNAKSFLMLALGRLNLNGTILDRALSPAREQNLQKFPSLGAIVAREQVPYNKAQGKTKF